MSGEKTPHEALCTTLSPIAGQGEQNRHHDPILRDPSLRSVRDPQSPQLWAAVGAAFGEIDARLAGFSHPAAHRTHSWDLRRAADTVRRRDPALPLARRSARAAHAVVGYATREKSQSPSVVTFQSPLLSWFVDQEVAASCFALHSAEIVIVTADLQAIFGPGNISA